VSDDREREVLIARLSWACDTGTLSDSARKQAEGFLQRLTCGVTIALCGAPGSGKSTLLHILLGEKPAPAGPEDCARLITRDGLQDAALAAGAPASMGLRHAAHPMLKNARLIDVQGSADAQTHAARHAWALGVADIVLWCGQTFGAADREIWEQAPDALKDHSFLVVTKADVLAQLGTLTAQLQDLQAVAADEFHSIFPTTAAQALPMLDARDGMSDSVYAASGVKALAEAVRRLVASGRQADFDGALLFLERHGVPATAPDAATGPAAAGADSGPSAARAGAPAPGETPAHVSYDAALALIRARAADIAREIEGPDEALAETVLMQCSALSEDLVTLIEDQAGDCPAFTAWRDDVMEANDKMVLMCLEGDLFSACDAVTIMLQLSKDVQQRAFH
jgi:hypothetical protein